ncbi:type IV toxin-antitoxin system AbiEi family antitoxin domain-containing protein [Microbacterium sulfonylureivorans]|uniref:type IV toxin-antitoxin system AbiEi family antitoxin domain-containing protein n=1 Tax=Microbacterium sulfonylureivorans TaxID=2486854 RepID=UPI001F0BA551|nr:type IV toxin-antitoxin system AbiEi family antitoxin domain-containing protein [Microbacterium sulfonylureivorans]
MLQDREVATRGELMSKGMTRRGLARALESGDLIRVRRDRYVAPTAPADIVQAVRVGGRLACLSLLKMLGVFVFGCDRVHLHVLRGASRLRSPTDRSERLPNRRDRTVRLHWLPLIRPAAVTSSCVGVIDALAQAVLCQLPRHAVATLDSALNKGLIVRGQLGEVFAALPARFGALIPLVDGRAESGPETLVRLMLLALGCSVELQVAVDGVGRVDMIVNGWLVVECDSRAFHSGWREQLRDRRRDAALAALGYPTLRLTAEDIMYEPESVLAALKGLVTSRQGVATPPV